MDDGLTIIDASGQNQCHPCEIRRVDSMAVIFQALKDAKTGCKKIVMFGAKHSQAGQVCHDGAIALDMNPYNRILQLDLNKKQITVESGIQWREIQEVIHPHGLALQVMQFVNTFSVAGSMSANIFSRDPRRSRLIELIVSFTLINADGEIIRCSRHENDELFTLAIEGHGLFGVIAEVTIQLILNTLLIPQTFTFSPCEYLQHVTYRQRKGAAVVYHQAQYLLSEEPFMEHITATNFYEISVVENSLAHAFTRHELMTATREMELKFWDPIASDSLLGFFIPVKSFLKFHEALKSILRQTSLNIFKCSLNDLPSHQESFLSPSLGSCIKVALFFRQEGGAEGKKAADALKENCALATVDAGGTIYLTFDFKASAVQMDLFYPKWRKFLAKKRRYDPKEIFYNQFYEKLCRLLAH